jgi:hypothetical protein
MRCSEIGGCGFRGLEENRQVEFEAGQGLKGRGLPVSAAPESRRAEPARVV